MRDYELLCLLPPDVDEERTEAVLARVRGSLEGQGGVVEKVDLWGKRRLAYEINGHRDGVYVLLTFKAGPQALRELERVLGLTDDVVRHVVVRLDGE
ncbi:MAG TPA: 30S ribosomal protein S6 [Bacillota bacterium]